MNKSELKTMITCKIISGSILIILGTLVVSWNFIVLAYLVWALIGLEKTLAKDICEYRNLKRG